MGERRCKIEGYTEFYQNFLDYRGSRSKLCMGDDRI